MDTTRQEPFFLVDVNASSIIQGSAFWRAEHEWPTEDFGLVSITNARDTNARETWR